MNAHLITNNHGLRLITEFEGAPRLKARLCEGGAWELSYGVTFYPDGTPVKEGDTCTPEKADAMFRHALGVFEDAVADLVRVELTPNQFSALVALCYNIGIDNFRTSTVLRETNASRFYDAAAAFGMWIFATKGGYKQALRGLLRRRYAEACLYLSYDWTLACDIDSIALTREPPASLPGRDTVRYKTPFSEVLAIAQKYPLADSPELVLDTPITTFKDLAAATNEVTKAEPVKAGEAGQPEKGSQPKAPADPAKEKAAAPAVSGQGSAVPAGEGGVPIRPPPPPVALPKLPQVPPPMRDPVVLPSQVGTKPPHVETKQPDLIPYRIDPNAGAKPLESTERFLGSVFILLGTLLRTLMANGFQLSGAAGIVAAWILTLMKDPVHFAILIAFCAMAIAAIGWFIGVLLQKLGVKKKRHGEETATQLMY